MLLLKTYNALERMSRLGRSAHLTKPLNRRSASLNSLSEGSSTILSSDRHAYNGAPKSNTDVLSAVTNYSLTLLLCKPNILALFLILRKATLAKCILRCRM